VIDSISRHPDFLRSSLESVFAEDPFGFTDVGSVGGVHPLILPLASRSRCTCFEPDPDSYSALVDLYSGNNPFADLAIHNCALAEAELTRRLYVTKSAVNTSLLEPDDTFASRYGVAGLEVTHTMDIQTRSLGGVLGQYRKENRHVAELIKLDCQGTEYDILLGAENLLDSECVALICEAEFVKMYRGQKTFSELDLFLGEKGFVLYGLEPHFVSARKLDRRSHETEERILWVDALYLKEPLAAQRGSRGEFTRQVYSLFLVALLSRNYAFAMELLDGFAWPSGDRELLGNLVRHLAAEQRQALERDTDKLLSDLTASPDKKYLIAKKFIDAHRSNSSIDFLMIS